MKFSKLIAYIVVAFFAVPLGAEEIPGLQNLLQKRLLHCNCSAILVEPKHGKILASVNSDPILREKHPPGSLMKVFTLIAYSQTHSAKFPEYQCPPSIARDAKGCWDRNGHGNVTAEKALAMSCNVYFRQLSLETSTEAFTNVARRFGILENENEWKDQQTVRKLMVGATMDWSVSPQLLLRGYSSLFQVGLSNDLRNVIRNGLREGSYSGTSREARIQAGVPMLGKTGTSLLMVNGIADPSRTQGLWIGLYPEDDPEIAIMTLVKNGRGATDAAPTGGRALAAWLEYTKRNLTVAATVRSRLN